MQVKSVHNYIKAQIDLEDRYKHHLKEYYLVLIGLLAGYLKKTDISKYQLQLIINNWKLRYTPLINRLNQQAAIQIQQFAIDEVLKITHHYSNFHQPILIAHDLTIGTDNLTNSIGNRFTQDIPTAVAILTMGYRYLLTEDGIDQLKLTSEHSIDRFVQTNVSQAVSNIIAELAYNQGYTEYQSDNQHDDRVRPLHREQNDGKTWHKINNPPSTGHPGTEWNCRCYYIAFR